MRAKSWQDFYVPGKYPKGHKPGRANFKTHFNAWLYCLDLELEEKLPNEFKGSIINYNSYNNSWHYRVNIWVDENQYCM